MYTIEWIGTIGVSILRDGEPRFVLVLEDGQQVPPEFKVGDEVRIVNHPADPASVAMGNNYGYYAVTHVPSGTELQIMHRVYAWQFE